jgi:inner membrane protease subunit 2
MALSSLWRRTTGQAGIAKAVAMNLVGFATWVPVLALFNIYVAEVTFVDGASMYPFMNSEKDSTLRQDVVLNWKRAPQRDLERGMIVTLRCVRTRSLMMAATRS